MKTSRLFDASLEQVKALIAAYPFGLVISQGDEGLDATPLPLLLQPSDDSAGPLQLLGHFARVNPQVARLQAQAEALIVFQGPQAYISPSWLSDRSQAPTWNFASVHLRVRIEFQPDEAAALAAVQTLTEAMEAGRPKAWQVPELGARLPRMLPAIIAFKATVLGVQSKFKLGQNERVEDLREMLAGLVAEGQTAMCEWMRAANASRLVEAGHR